MKNKFFITDLVKTLNKKNIIAYPTESVFGFGCDPDSKLAVQKLLILKQRSWTKGLILVAANYEQLVSYIDDRTLDSYHMDQIFYKFPTPITWIIPANSKTPYWLTGKYSSIAVRITTFEPVQRLCLKFGKPLVSTSANLSGQYPIRNYYEIRQYFGSNFPLMEEEVEGRLNPTEIRDILYGTCIRKS